MAKALKEALVEVEALSEADQETIGRELLAHVEKLRGLRSDLQRAARSVDAGRAKEISVNDVIDRAHREYGSR